MRNYRPPIKSPFVKMSRPAPVVPVTKKVEDGLKLLEQFNTEKANIDKAITAKLTEIVGVLSEVVDFRSQMREHAEALRVEVERLKATEIVGEKGDKGDDGDPGNDGYTPIKDIDYFDGKSVTVEEVIPVLLPAVLEKMPKPEKAKDGVTPIRGVDYFTDSDIEELISQIQRGIKIPVKEVAVDPISAVEEYFKNPKKKLKVENIDGLSQTIAAMNSQLGRGYLHGGGDTIKQGTNIVLTRNSDGTVTISATSSGASFQVPTSGAVNGTNTSFTFATAPSVIVVDQGRPMQQVSTEGTVNWTGTTAIVLTVAPTFDIFAL